MTLAFGMFIYYEWEHVRNNLKMDNNLRQHLDKLKELKPTTLI